MNISPDTLFHLTRHLRNTNSAMSVTEAADMAIRLWLAAAAEKLSGGFYWKTLFLPEGSRLRIWSHPELPEACVIGTYLLCDGRPVSSNQYAASCGGHRNAWELISVLLPGKKYRKQADLLRRPTPASPDLDRAAPAAAAVPAPLHRVGERRAWNLGGRRWTDGMPEQDFGDH
jgi:hypothetical protein